MVNTKWLNNTDPRSYYGGTLAVNNYNKSVSQRRHLYPYLRQDYDEAIQDLDNKGFHILKGVIPANILLSLRQEMDKIISTGVNLKVNNNHWQVVDQPLVNCSKIAFDIATRDIIVNIASEFFKCTPALGTLNLRKSLVNNLPEDTTNFFHVDPNSIKFLKFFLYFNDVKDPNDGPLTLIEGSHNNKFDGWQRKYRWTEEEILNIYGKASMKHMFANVGDLIVARTTSFHRGTKVKSNNRYMYTINYVVHPEEFKQPSFKVRNSDVNSLSKTKQPICDFLLKI